MSKVSRRSFARNALVAATAAAVLPDAIAQTTPPSPPMPDRNATIAPPETPPPNAEVEARISWINAKYGARLNDAQKADIRRIIAGGQAGVDAMRAYPLDNSVAPATPFRPFRGGRR